MPCTPIAVSLEVDTPDDKRRILIGLDRLCNNNGSAEWELHFELQERGDDHHDFKVVAKLDVDINREDHAAAEATAKHGLDEDQRSQAAVAAETAKTGTKEEAADQAELIIPARNPASPVA